MIARKVPTLFVSKTGNCIQRTGVYHTILVIIAFVVVVVVVVIINDGLIATVCRYVAVGNAVSPPLVAAIARSLLHAVGLG